MMHKQMAAGKWNQLTLMHQMANIGSDIFRTIKWKKHGDTTLSKQAFFRALELLELTIADPKHYKKPCRKELVRLKEVLIDYFMYDNQYKSSDALWENYFYRFNYAAALERGL